MKYSSTLIAVRDMEKSKQFYHDVLGLDVIADFGANVTLTGDIEYVHPLLEHSWGQRVVRFYDLDKHIIEVGENINMVIKLVI